MDFVSAHIEEAPLSPDLDAHSPAEESQNLVSQWNSNPLPRIQFATVLVVGLCYALPQYSILPFINQFVSELEIVGGDQRKVGYYVGLLEMLFNVSSTLTVLQWSRLSDRIGRKSVLMIGAAASAVSISLLGLSRTFSGLVTSRCLLGLFDSSAVVASVIGEVTDSTNRASAFTFSLVSGSVGGSIGALIGGSLSNPSIHFHGFFDGNFWKQYPYFLPCFVVALIGVASFLFVHFLFEETVIKAKPLYSLRNSEELFTLLSSDSDGTYSVRQLLAYPPVLISLVNHMSLNFMFTCEGALVPLFFAMPIEIGGLGLDPAQIGYILGGYRAFMVLFMLTGSLRIIRRYGERFAFIMGTFSCMSLWILMPFINLCARSSGMSTTVWAGVVFITLPLCVMEMATACIFVYVISAAPTRRSFGAVSGIMRMAASITQIVAPFMATSLFSFSVKHNLLGGYLVYAFLFTLSCFAVLVAVKLPDNPNHTPSEPGYSPP